VKKKYYTLALLLVLFVLSASRYFFKRWHNQEMMLERLYCFKMIMEIIEEDPAATKETVARLIDGQYGELEFYLTHPLKLDRRMPLSLGMDENHQSVYTSTIAPLSVDRVREERSMFRHHYIDQENRK